MARYEEMDAEGQAAVDAAVEQMMGVVKSKGCTCAPTVYVFLPWSAEVNVVGIELKHTNLCHGLLRQRAQEGNN